MKSRAIFLVGFLTAVAAVAYSQISDYGDAIVVQEEPQVEGEMDNEEMEVEQYFTAVKTHDDVLIPLVFVAEVITDEDREQFVSLSETVFSQMDADQADKGAEMVMLHINRNREKPVWVEVIRVTE